VKETLKGKKQKKLEKMLMI